MAAYRKDPLIREAARMTDSNGLSVGRLLEALRDPTSESDLRRYYGVGARSEAPPAFTGSRFELLGGGGDDEKIQDTITATDLVAVGMLGVRIPARVCLDLLEGDLGREINDQLSFIPTDVQLVGHPQAAAWLVDDSHADRAWKHLRDQEGVGFVIAGKILARKRPRLIPVYDNVVRCAIGHPNRAWEWFGSVCGSDLIHAELARLHHDAELPLEVGLLRVLDVVVWMRHRDHHTGTACKGIS